MSNPELALAESVSTTNASYFICVYILILIYCCFGLAVVCDVYFVPAIQKLSQTYDLPPDIAGSTLMALGASVPELFASLIGVFVTEDDIGTGSIIGSSCFNLIAVPAACAFVASAAFTKKLIISPMPVIRNSAFYAITILVLLLIIKDNKVDLLEASILLIFFVLYMALMIFSAQNSKKHNHKQLQQNHYDHHDQQVSSFNDSSCSYNSSCADSAIAGCRNNNNNNNDTGTRRNSHNSNSSSAAAAAGLKKEIVTEKRSLVDLNNNQQQQRQQIIGNYGQFYFAVKPTADSLSSSNERTPLVSLHQPVYYQQYHSQQDGQYQQQQQQQPSSNHLVESSSSSKLAEQQQQQQFRQDCGCVTVDLGAVAIKNSACLSNSLRLEQQQQQQQKQRFNYSNSFDNDSISEFKRKQNQLALGDNLLADNDNDDNLLHEENWVSSKWILVPMLPLTLSMKILTPCKFKNTFWTIWTFILSIALIGALTYVSVCMVSMLGQVMGIPETVAGMTILSWGTGIPELIASIVLIKKTAKADMAICNTIGSNVIDVSFCLSLPWIVKCLMSKAAGFKPQVEIHSAALPWTCFTLLLSVMLLLLILKLHDWVLGFSVGCWLMVVYVAFVGLATYLESSFAKDGLDLMALF